MTTCNRMPSLQRGFTLIELSIVLVIIGLIVGGILTGQDLISAASVRAQISQIEKYQTAVRTFQGKYGYLPGDMPDPYASNFGFQARGSLPGQGDGNGLLEGRCSGSTWGWFTGCGEPAVFWEDLSAAGLIDYKIFGYDNNGVNWPYMLGFNTGPTISTNPAIKDWIPTAKIGNATYVSIYNTGNGGSGSINAYTNFFNVSAVTKIGNSIEADPGIAVRQAYMIDSKMDDGLPQTGSVNACYVDKNTHSAPVWSKAGHVEGAPAADDHCGSITTTATAYGTTNCYDNNGVAGVQKYSTAQNGSSLNCALSFKFQ